MIFLSQSKKIVLLALSLFFVSLSVLFVLSSQNVEENGRFGNNLFGSLFASEHAGESYELLLDEKNGPSLVLTKSGEFVASNQAFRENFSYDENDLRTKEFFSFFHPEDLGTFVGIFTKIVQQKDQPQIYVGPLRFSNKNQDYRLVIISMEQKKNFIVLHYKDITDSVEDLRDGDGASDGESIREMKNDKKPRIVVEKP